MTLTGLRSAIITFAICMLGWSVLICLLVASE